MKIIKKRIRKCEKYLSGIETDERFYITLTNLNDFTHRLGEIGFATITEGAQVLPAVLGRVSRFNADGSFKIQRNLPKETVSRDAEITDWHGYTHLVSIPYQRYPRIPIPSPSIELVIKRDAANNLILSSPILTNSVNNYNLNKHVINLFLEFFGECDVYHENLIPAFNVDVRRLNWNVLPAGEYPWESLRPHVEQIINGAPVHRQKITEKRIKVISAHNPDFVGIGRAGFRGYLIFGFSKKDIFILESIYTGNATYVLGKDWVEVSRLTKEQILSDNLHRERFIHRDGWEEQINRLVA